MIAGYQSLLSYLADEVDILEAVHPISMYEHYTTCNHRDDRLDITLSSAVRADSFRGTSERIVGDGRTPRIASSSSCRIARLLANFSSEIPDIVQQTSEGSNDVYPGMQKQV